MSKEDPPQFARAAAIVGETRWFQLKDLARETLQHQGAINPEATPTQLADLVQSTMDAKIDDEAILDDLDDAQTREVREAILLFLLDDADHEYEPA